jgi:hypothetical protein
MSRARMVFKIRRLLYISSFWCISPSNFVACRCHFAAVHLGWISGSGSFDDGLISTLSLNATTVYPQPPTCIRVIEHSTLIIKTVCRSGGVNHAFFYLKVLAWLVVMLGSTVILLFVCAATGSPCKYTTSRYSPENLCLHSVGGQASIPLSTALPNGTVALQVNCLLCVEA